MKIHGLLTAPVLFLLAACGGPSETEPTPVSDATEVTQDRPNPLLVEWQTPFGVPPFDLIESEDYLTALREGMR